MSGSNAEIKEASILGPVAALTTTAGYEGALRGVARYATSTGSLNAALPTKTIADGRTSVIPLRGKFLRIANESSVDALTFAFGIGAAPTLVHGELATFATGDVNAGWRIPPDQYLDVIVPKDATHVAWIQPAGAVASTIAFYCSEGNVGA
jgi:hypothetical protein